MVYLSFDEDIENTPTEALKATDDRIPTTKQLQNINEEIADTILRNGIVSLVKQEQFSQKKNERDELKAILN